MRKVFLFFIALLLLPQFSSAAGISYEEWGFKEAEDIRAWDFQGMETAHLSPEGLVFDIETQATMFRDLPDGFHDSVDAIELSYDPTGLEEVTLLLLSFDDSGDIARRFRLGFLVTRNGPVRQYVPLDLYRKDIKGTEKLAVVFRGNAQNVSFQSVRFIRYGIFEKIGAMWESFWNLQPFEPFTINILHGPTISTDAGPTIGMAEWQHILARSVNAYFLVGLSLFGFLLLFIGLYRTEKRGEEWNAVRRSSLALFLGAILGVWLFYDFRMGTEFLRNVIRDHHSFIAAPASQKKFRDLGRFPEFVKFARPYLINVDGYEVFFHERWPYFGMLRYETYPAKPNPNDPQFDTWVIYDRTDMAVDAEGRLLLSGKPITQPGEILGRFDDRSFIFRGIYTP